MSKAENTKLNVCLRSGKGRLRKNNEDNFYIDGLYSELCDADTEKKQSFKYTKDSILFAVCDGMGGVDNGELAAFIACKQLLSLSELLKEIPYAETVQNWITQTNRLIANTLDKGGCTLAIMFVKDGAVHASNVGDSRIYLFSENTLTRVSKDHSKVQLLADAGILTPEQADTHPQKNIITRYLGMNENLVGTCAPYHAPVREPHAGDLYLICSDGVSDMLFDNEIESIMRHSGSLSECADALYESALKAGGRDNLTLILIQFEGEPSA